ncbi:MAG: nucleotidyltransferase family protein [Candidatus Aegiribacteria sp.]|nr:nucleotidyltransferase family protein [Candidatus Aegiribacteria sp.]
MKNIEHRDAITVAACQWLLSGGLTGAYSGPDPGPAHDLSPLLAKEMGRKDISLSAAGAWFRQEQIVRPVLERLSEAGIEVWAIKGFDLARSVYPFPGGRPMCDADVFLDDDNRQKILSIFTQSGWSRGSPGDGIFNSGIVSEMKMYKHDVMVELHTHIFYFPATFPGRLPIDLFDKGRLLEPGLMGFAWHNALLMVLLHMLTNVRIRPVWWVDICMLCMKISKAGTWAEFARNAFETKLGNSIATLLGTASVELEAPVPGSVLEVLRVTDSGREDIIEKLKSGRKVPTLLNLRYLTGWKRISWLYALFWLVLTGQHPLRRK